MLSYTSGTIKDAIRSSMPVNTHRYIHTYRYIHTHTDQLAFALANLLILVSAADFVI